MVLTLSLDTQFFGEYTPQSSLLDNLRLAHTCIILESNPIQQLNQVFKTHFLQLLNRFVAAHLESYESKACFLLTFPCFPVALAAYVVDHHCSIPETNRAFHTENLPGQRLHKEPEAAFIQGLRA